MKNMNHDDSAVKVLAMADLHGLFPGVADVPQFEFQREQLTIVAGDVAGDDEHGISKEGGIPIGKWMKSRLEQFCCEKGRCDAKVLLVFGNHDRYVYWDYNERDLPRNLTVLCDKQITFKGLRIYGTSWCPWSKHGEKRTRSQIFEAGSGMLRLQFAKIPEGLDILVSHCPPRIGPFASSELASQELFERIQSMSRPPRYLICGHCHVASPVEFDVACATGAICHVLCVATTSKMFEIEKCA